MAWRVSEVVADSLSDLWAMSARALALLTIACASAGGLAAVSVLDAQSLRDTTTNLRREGWLTTEVLSQRTAAIDAASCRDAGDMPGVADVVGVSRGEPEHVTQLGNRSVMVHRIRLSDDAWQQYVANSHTAAASTGYDTAWVGRQLAGQIRDQQVLTFRSGQTVVVEDVVPADFGITALDGSIVLPMRWNNTDDHVDQCFVFSEPAFLDSAPIAAGASMKIDSLTPIIRPVASSIGEHPYVTYLGRVMRWAPALVGVLVGLVWVLATRTRSSEVGVLRLSGMSSSEVALYLTTQLVLLAATWFSVLIAGSLIACWVLGTGLPVAGWPYAVVGVAALTGLGTMGNIAVARVDVSHLLKDR